MIKQDDPLWYKDAVFYEVYVRAFHDSNADGHGDLPGLTAKLDYIQNLGFDCIWLLPIYPSPLKDDGYDIADYYNIHPDYGTLEDFEILTKEAHQRGIRIIADLVLNHTSNQHPWFQSARKSRSSKYRDYYVWSDTNRKYKDARIIFIDTETSNWTWDDTAGQYYWHRFYSSQPDLNFNNPAVQEEMFNVMKFWLDLGIDGFRVDAVPYLFEREGTICENLPETHDYLKRLRKFIDTNYPGRVLLCEANQWPEDVRPYFGDGDEFHIGFHFPIMPRIFMAIRKSDISNVKNIMARTPEIPSNCQWCTFLRNHDELTLEMVTEEERQWMWQEYAPESRMRLNLGIRRRLAPLLDGDQRKIELANSILFSLIGTPIIYYGDEIGMGDNIWLEDRAGVRTPMQWENSPDVGFSHADPKKFYLPVINDPIFGYEHINVKDQQNCPSSLLNQIKKMIAVHKAYRAFGRGDFSWVDVDNDAIAAYLRTYQDERILVIQNLSATSQAIAFPLDTIH
ncbi:MAG: maltose alpha-D-glucosyltransferase, partial [Anaerolineales bacterium]|nr:maltose alpha-D-glucosyltransferase [Anaerolineales bacterium]